MEKTTSSKIVLRDFKILQLTKRTTLLDNVVILKYCKLCIWCLQQYGFCTNHSDLAIVAIYDDIIFNKDNKLVTYMILCFRLEQSFQLC